MKIKKTWKTKLWTGNPGPGHEIEWNPGCRHNQACFLMTRKKYCRLLSESQANRGPSTTSVNRNDLKFQDRCKPRLNLLTSKKLSSPFYSRPPISLTPHSPQIYSRTLPKTMWQNPDFCRFFPEAIPFHFIPFNLLRITCICIIPFLFLRPDSITFKPPWLNWRALVHWVRTWRNP